MKILTINSKRYGTLDILLDDEDFVRVSSDFNNLKWCVTKNHKGLYAQKRTSTGKVYLHRYIMNNPNGIVDHINKNTLDNRKCNLRVTTNANNLRNGTLRINNTTGTTGVYYDAKRKRYAVTIKVNYKTIHLGRYKTLDEAINVRKKAEVKYWAM